MLFTMPTPPPGWGEEDIPPARKKATQKTATNRFSAPLFPAFGLEVGSVRKDPKTGLCVEVMAIGGSLAKVRRGPIVTLAPLEALLRWPPP